MSKQQLSKSLAAPPDQEARNRAIDPSGSFIVQAPAGSGKTTLLVNRYLALLNIANEPEEVLAITFTRKAAEEMRLRVLELLRNQSIDIAQKVLKRSEDRKWNLLQSSNRMRIQTIDSFQQGLVQRLPYHSKHNLDYELLNSAGELFQYAAANVIQRVVGRKERFGDEIAGMIAAFDNNTETLEKLLAAMLQKREQWVDAAVKLARAELSESHAESIFEELQATRQKFCAQRKQTFLNTIENSNGLWRDLKKLTEQHIEHRSKDQLSYTKMESPDDWSALVNLFLTQENGWRKTVDKRHGFPEKVGPLSKETFSVASGKLQACPNAGQALQKLRNLPHDNMSEELRKNLTNYALTLVACIEELALLFESLGIVDHTERAIAARRALRVDDAPTQLALALDYRIRHILVDEYQDTSIAQNDMLNLLMEGWEPNDGNTFFAVGDPMQSIYKFRDADLRNFLYADNGGIKHRVLEKLQLSSNFRSTADLVDWFNKTFEPIFGGEDDAEMGRVQFSHSHAMLQSKEDSNVDVQLFLATSRGQEADAVAKKILELHTQHPEHSIALLVKKRSVVNDYYEAFRKHNVPWRDVEMESLFDIAVVRDLLALTCAILDSEDDLQWATLLTCPLVGIDFHDVELIFKDNRGREALLEVPPKSIHQDTKTILNRVRRPLCEALTSHQLTLRSRVERAWFQLGGANAYASNGEQYQSSLHTVKEHAKHFFETLETINEDYIDSDLLTTLLQDTLASASHAGHYVEVMTIHKAKGLEYDHVILPALDATGQKMTREPLYAKPTPDNEVLVSIKSDLVEDEMHDLMYEIEKEQENNELRRLFYVGATRAKYSLSLFGTVKDAEKLGNNTHLSMLHPQDSFNEENWTFEESTKETEASEPSDDTPQKWFRIAPEFHFKQPEQLNAIDPLALNKVLDVEASLKKDVRVNPVALAIGQIVHEALQWMATTGDLSMPNTYRIEKWRNQLQAGGFSTRDIATMLEGIQDQLRRTTGDETGQWLLDSSHEDSQVEQAYSDYSGAFPKTLVVDRTFIDKGTRWIIDYKTTMIPDDSDLPLEEKAKNHEPQLASYANLFRNIEDIPTKAGIFFTDVARLIEVELVNDVAQSYEQLDVSRDRLFKASELADD